MTAGNYTKVTLSANGTVLNATQIEASDLPSHTHSSSDIIDLEDFIKDVLSSLFVDNDENNIAFEYDKSTETLSAEIKYDGVTIKQNEYGELYVDTSAISSDGNDYSATISTLSAKVDELEEKLSNASSAADFEIGKGLKLEDGILSVDPDEYTIIFDQDTNQIKVDTDVAGGGSGSSEKSSCGTHTHTSSQITDFEDAVNNLISKSGGITIDDLADLIDGVTIQVDENGLLTAVSSVVGSHTHTTADITDWDDDWLTRAINQEMSSYEGSIPDGLKYINFSSQTLGRAFIALDYAVQGVQDDLDQLKTEFNAFKINAIALSLGAASFKIADTSKFAQMYDKHLKRFVDRVYADSSVKLQLSGFNQLNGTLSLYYDNVLVSTVDCSRLTSVGFSYGSFTVSDIMVDPTTNTPSNYILSIAVPESTEDGTHIAQLKYVSSSNRVQESATLSYYSTIHDSMVLSTSDSLDTHKKLNANGELEDFYTYDDSSYCSGSLTMQIADYTTYRFVPIQRDVDYSDYEVTFDNNTGIFTIDGKQVKSGTTEVKAWYQDMFAPASQTIKLSKNYERSASKISNSRAYLSKETGDSFTIMNHVVESEPLKPSSTVIDDIAIGLSESMSGYYSLTFIEDVSDLKNAVLLSNVPAGSVCRLQWLDDSLTTLRCSVSSNKFDGYSYAKQGEVFVKSKVDTNISTSVEATCGLSNYPYDASHIAVTLYWPVTIRKVDLSSIQCQSLSLCV